ncbi:MAG: DUF533 domain-containing protein [Gemmatimonadetes bacterium]|nr:DUF533 domain-containing protein [Gemmatimonadota bacterium]MBK7831849.1 DUF533 domain-containing protein [Gemmatimonadota bacterium]
MTTRHHPAHAARAAAMNPQDAHTIIAIAALAANADGTLGQEERVSIISAAEHLGLSGDDPRLHGVMTGSGDVAQLAHALTSDEARIAAYDVAAAVCHADGTPNAQESAFLSALSRELGAVAPSPEAAATLGAAAQAVSTAPTGSANGDLDTFILDQAMLAGAAELLPHRFSGMAILPLQLRMVYQIGQRHGQQFDMSQAKDLAAVFGIGAAGHLMEGIVRGVLGSVGRGLLGGLLGSATGAAAGVAVTFATTYALGHAAEQYYAQGRTLSTSDLKALFTRFQGEANTVFPRAERRIRELAAGSSLDSLLGGLMR